MNWICISRVVYKSRTLAEISDYEMISNAGFFEAEYLYVAMITFVKYLVESLFK